MGALFYYAPKKQNISLKKRYSQNQSLAETEDFCTTLPF